MTHVAVVGGGISGLAGAHRLRTLLGPSARITLVDRADRLGGVLRTVELAGVAVDVGAEAFLARRPEVPALLAELGLTEQLVHPSAAVAPSVRAGGRTVPLPGRTLLGVPSSASDLSALLSEAGLAKAAGERDRPLRWSPGEDVAVGGLLRARFGDEVADRLVDPLLSGVYAGRVDALGLRATIPTLAAALDAGAPSLTAATDTLLPPSPPPRVIQCLQHSDSVPPARRFSHPGSPGPVFGALRGGYRVLVDALRAASGVEQRLGLPVRGLARRLDGWRLEIGTAVAPEALDVDAVLLAVPAPVLRKLLADAAPSASRVAGAVELASPVVVALAYRAEDAATLPDTSGILIAADEPLYAKAFTHSARKWPHLAAEATDGLLRLRASLGRAGESATLRVPDEELVGRVRADLETLTGVAAAPVSAHVQRWGGGLPQYGVGHGELVAELERAVAEQPGLAVAGAVLHGVGVPACIGTGRAAAERLVAQLATRPGDSARVSVPK
ncbi:protoporphyrinogen oxidase [Pseudonocardia eucalypti]|uniref:Coproporphyrinogen III oxidase n=1 Tax=Pseudonocardia eucalypti TaxID=648755 RepID=A0ABP9R725_9PSEU|nr:oxygen-dependent protoporphyrinogen oxidase [Pseudonocardia eucalypti]